MDKNEKTLKHRICIRMIICMGIFALIGAGIVRNLFKEQVINHELRVAEAQEQTQVERNLQSPRGMILDRNGKVLAISEMSCSATRMVMSFFTMALRYSITSSLYFMSR